MATYNKKLKTLAVHLMLDSEVVNIADTVDNDMATRALNEFKKYDTMHYETESGGQKVTNAIPYHAVQYIEVTEADGSISREDPYGCDEGGGTKGDCDHTELGNLMYCGGAGYGESEFLIAFNGEVADGVSSDYTDAGTWMAIMDANCIKGVFNGNVITPTIEDRHAVFGDYVTISEECDADIDECGILVEQNTPIEHYAVYTNYDLDLSECRY